MKSGALSLGVLLLATNALAHRLDEYLQAIRIAVTTNRLEVAVDLTPGVAVAKEVLAEIDKNRDGQVADAEAKSYARRFFADLKLDLDGTAITLTSSNSVFPAMAELRTGHGVIRLRAATSIGALATGRHSLTLTNLHLPAISVFLVNALRPVDRSVEILRQTRNQIQSEYRLEFDVRSSVP
ncbi:MAG: hypothetical protein AB7O66_07355 [Limisphaerales bacterium]